MYRYHVEKYMFTITNHIREVSMKRYQRLISILFFVTFCVVVGGFSAQAAEKVINLKFASYMPPMHKGALEIEGAWCKEVEKRTNGRVKVTYFPGGTLVPATQAYEAVIKGIADIALVSPSWTTGRFPLAEALALPLGFKSAVQSTGLANAWYKKFKPKEFDDTKMLWLSAMGPGVFLTKKPVDSIEGLKGLKIRAGGNEAKIVSAMGAVPVSVPMSDIYEGLQRGLLEGILFYPEALKGWKYGDNIRGLQENRATSFAGLTVTVMNKQKWNSLPPDIQNIIDKINDEWAIKQGELWVELDKEGREFGVSKGMKIVNISNEEVNKSAEKMKPIFKDYVESMKAKGLPGEESLNFCVEYVKAHP
jgi:TRAP-type transport system periplasmic protein